jgi:NTE family protein
MRPQSLLDNKPLEKLLVKMVPLVRLPRLIRKGHLKALAVTASSYSSGEHVTFFESAEPVKPWVRSQRKAARDRITHEHLLASSAIPFIFPAKGIEVDDHIEYFGDGSMRQSAPIAPAIHLGAERILVDRRRPHARAQGRRRANPRPTTRRWRRLRARAVQHLSGRAGGGRGARAHQPDALAHPRRKRTHSALRPIELLVIAPSQRLDAVAARHVGDLPRPCAPCWARWASVEHGRRAARRWPATCCLKPVTPRS